MCSWMVVILLLWHHSKIKMELICYVVLKISILSALYPFKFHADV